MFQSVINQPGLRAGRFGTGMWVSLMVHAGVFGGMLGLTGKAVEQIKEDPVLTFEIPRPPKGNPIPPKAVQQPVTPKPKKPKTELVQPKKIPPPPPETQPVAEPPPTPDEPETAANDLPYVPGSHPDGVEKGGVPGAPAIAAMMLTNTPEGTGEEVIPFGAGMTPPQLISEGAPIQYTREAVEARVSGLVIARCTITREGDIENCRIIKGLPHMDDAVLSSLTTRRYRPVSFQGRNVSVSYIFNVKIRMP
ncbi:energy transducer TonB [Archangium lipolyticum]|uniref:energy transducer TonB n=1 Tax=Archangium lipolyticum TaxID=2970465 RepID=UPI002149CB06|nr:energy transducer TonB [Archangium lipolyticum]